MIAIQITDLKKFMSVFLTGTAFDEFLLLEGSLTTFCTFQFDGHWQQDFFGDPENENTAPPVYTPWKDVRGYVYSLMKGKHLPLAFRFIFQYPPAHIGALFARHSVKTDPGEILSLSLNLRFDGSRLVLTTGTSLRTFSMDRTPDTLWDETVLAFLKKQQIAS
ncbi:MAG: DUF5721 family protein, partial [Lachnospiraceae bacterium]|nr:DUF5721 family protein [Lachnospiraceae bacterium]